MRPAETIEQLRWQVIWGYGFTPFAQAILATAPLTVKDWQNTSGGGLTYHDRIELEGRQHQAALHEFCHWVHERTSLLDPAWLPAFLVEYKALAGDPAGLRNEDTPANFARLQLYGDAINGGTWPGVLALADWDHAWVSLASYTMGKYQNGPRALPEPLWLFFAPFFTGDCPLRPYYEGGHP